MHLRLPVLNWEDRYFSQMGTTGPVPGHAYDDQAASMFYLEWESASTNMPQQQPGQPHYYLGTKDGAGRGVLDLRRGTS